MYELWIGTKIGDLEWPWTAKWPLFSVISLNLVVSGAHCVTVVDKAITMDDLRLLCLVVNVCRGTARRPRYKFLADLLIQDLMLSTCLAIVFIQEAAYELLIGTKIGDLEWPWTAKWPLFCVIFPYSVVSGAHGVKLVDKAITMGNLRLLCLVVYVCRGIARRPR